MCWDNVCLLASGDTSDSPHQPPPVCSAAGPLHALLHPLRPALPIAACISSVASVEHSTSLTSLSGKSETYLFSTEQLMKCMQQLAKRKSSWPQRMQQLTKAFCICKLAFTAFSTCLRQHQLKAQRSTTTTLKRCAHWLPFPLLQTLHKCVPKSATCTYACNRLTDPFPPTAAAAASGTTLQVRCTIYQLANQQQQQQHHQVLHYW